MKILIINPAAIPCPPAEVYGGIEWVTYWLADGLSNMGHDVALVGLEGSKSPNDKVKTYITWSTQEKYAEVLLADRIVPIINEFNPDIISDASHEKRVFPVAQRLGIPYIPNSHTHGNVDLGVTKPCWTALSKAHARLLNKRYGVNAKICYNGILTSTKAIVNPRAKIGNYIFVGRPNAEKGALEVIDFCKRNNLPLDVIAGRLEIEPVAYAMLIAQECKVGSKQVYHGGVPYDKKMQMLAQSKAFLFFPNWEEPFGLTPVEAGFVGTPAIVNDMGAMPEIVEDGKTGFVIPVVKNEVGEAGLAFNRYNFYRTVYDEEKIKDALAKLDTLDLEYISKRVRERFSIESMAKQYLTVYNKYLDGERW